MQTGPSQARGTRGRLWLVTWTLELFHSTVREVPAYADFVQRNGVRVDAVQTLEDFRALPVTNKQNYHRCYPLADLCRGGKLHLGDQLAVSSGSTGEPCIWPRRIADEAGTTKRFEQVLIGAFEAHQKATLCVVCFALGNWIGGMYTTMACRALAAAGHPLTVATPGNHVPEILRVVRAVAPLFEQVVLLGYPPFLRDVIDAGQAAGVDWPALRTKLVAAGEVFDEGWRARLCDRLGAADPGRTIVSLYGTADGGVLANETPTSVLIRRALAERSELVLEFFGQSRLPTLCQFAPTHRCIEKVGDHVVFSADGILPLIRYDILDQGGVITAAEMRTFLRTHGLTSIELASDAEPFVYVFGRAGSAVSFYGANVYPENIGPGLHSPELAGKVTGKFVLEVAEGAGGPSLHITVELVRGIEPTAELAAAIRESLHQKLLEQNSEYAHYVPEARRSPEIVLRPFADPTDFPPGAKHRYTRH